MLYSLHATIDGAKHVQLVTVVCFIENRHYYISFFVETMCMNEKSLTPTTYANIQNILCICLII